MNNSFWFKSYFWLAVSAMGVVFVIARMIGFYEFTAACLALMQAIASVEASQAIAIVAGFIAIYAFFREIPSWSQRHVYTTYGEYIPPKPADGEPQLHDGHYNIGKDSVLGRYVLESVKMSVVSVENVGSMQVPVEIDTNEADARLVCCEVNSNWENPDWRLLRVGNDLWTGDKSTFDGHRYTVERQYNRAFSGRLSVGAKNHSSREMLCHFSVQYKTIHSLGELVLDRYFRSLTMPLLAIFQGVLKVARFQPDVWLQYKIDSLAARRSK